MVPNPKIYFDFVPNFHMVFVFVKFPRPCVDMLADFIHLSEINFVFFNVHIFGLYESITKISLWLFFGNRSLKGTEIMIFRILFTSYFLFFESIATRALGSTPAHFV